MTVALGTNIANPISTALSQWLGFDTMGKLANYGKLGVTDPDAVITALFANSEQGAWYDPSDLSTMFQDSAGSTPVTAVGQPVGLILDKSKGLTLGPELVVNGDLSGGTTGFTSVNATISVVGGSLRVTKTDVYGQARTTAPTVAGKTYEATVLCTGSTSGLLVAGINIGLASPSNDVIGSYVSGIGQTSKAIFTATGTTAYIQVISQSGTGYDDWDNISLKELPGNHASQPTAAKRPLLQNDGVNNYLAFDGVDDALATASINFTATDKMSVFSGVQKVDDTVRIVCELSSSSGGNNGAFYIVSGNDQGFVAYSSMGRGTEAAGPLVTSGLQVVTGVDTAVLTMTHDIPGDLSTIRRNAVAGTSATGDKGTGNFGNYPLFICARNQASLFFTGRIYSLIVLGRLATTQEITDTETWVNGKTGAY